MSLFSWGSDKFGQLGVETSAVKGAASPSGGSATDPKAPPHTSTPTIVPGLEGVELRQVSAAYGHSIAVSVYGDVYTWGKSVTQTQSGGIWAKDKDGEDVRKRPTPLPGLRNQIITAVCAGGNFSVAISQTGRCYWWGLIFIHLNPTSASGATVASGGVAANHMTLPGLAADVATDPHQAFVRRMLRASTLKYLSGGSRGSRKKHRTGEDSTSSSADTDAERKATTDLDEMTALSISRVIVREPVLITSLRDKAVHGIAAYAGYAHAVILDDQGNIYSAGYNDRGQLGHGNRLASADFRNVELPPGLKIASASCGQTHNVALTTTGRVVSWGSGALGQLGHGSTSDRLHATMIRALLSDSSPVISVSCGANHTVAVTEEGDVYSWGHAEYGQHGKQLQIMGATRPTRPPRHPTATLIMAASVSHTTINPAGGPVPDHTATAAHPPPLRPAPNSAATVGDYMVAGSYFYTPRIITRSGMGEECDRIVSVAAGAQFTFGVTQAGVVLAWGWDAYGCLGRGGDRTVMDFESVPALRGIRVSSISPGADHVLCITEPEGHPFAKQVASLLEDGVPYSDVELVCTTASGGVVAGTSCRAHKFLLAARCPMLTELLLSNGEHSGIDGVVTGFSAPDDGGLQLHFANVKVQTIKALLTYVYSDVLRAPAHRMAELRNLAEMLRLPRLVWLCDRYLSPATASAAVDHPQSTFVADLSALLSNTSSAFADTKITVKHASTDVPVTFSLHRPLGHRYPYFRALLSGNFLEATAVGGFTATVEDDVVTPDVFADVLRFMMPDLVSAAEARILAFVDASNAKECMEFAAVHGFSRLEQMCRDFLGL